MPPSSINIAVSSALREKNQVYLPLFYFSCGTSSGRIDLCSSIWNWSRQQPMEMCLEYNIQGFHYHSMWDNVWGWITSCKIWIWEEKFNDEQIILGKDENWILPPFKTNSRAWRAVTLNLTILNYRVLQSIVDHKASTSSMYKRKLLSSAKGTFPFARTPRFKKLLNLLIAMMSGFSPHRSFNTFKVSIDQFLLWSRWRRTPLYQTSPQHFTSEAQNGFEELTTKGEWGGVYDMQTG